MKDEPVITLSESREAVGFAAIFFGVVGFCLGVLANSEFGRFYVSVLLG